MQKLRAFQGKRIRLVTYKHNTQKIGAVNEVLKQVSGELVAFQDADDWSEPNRIEEQVKEFINDPELGICFTNYQYVGNKIGMPGKIALTNEELRDEFLNYTYKRKAGASPTICGTMMITKIALGKTGGYHPYFAGRVAEDSHWIYRILKDFKGITLDKVLYNYLIRPGSFTQVQTSGLNAKYAYSWQLLSKIIYKDIHESIDVLHPDNIKLLKKLELEACEDALVEKIQLLNQTIGVYENSVSFKLGRFILSPWRFLKSIKK